jgi:multiple sugar transport system ATP-binding protein
MAQVALEHVSKKYPNGVQAVQDLTLTVADGELLVLIGPSGCGKTTTLRLIAGLETPSQGSIAIGGRVVDSVPPRDRDVALVFQQHVLYPHLSVRRNLGFGLEMRQRQRWPLPWRREARARPDKLLTQRVLQVAEMLGLKDVLDRLPGQLSGGQQQRVALGRAVVRQPAVLLLDEPLSHLDIRLRTELRRELHLLQRRLQATMVYVTHDPGEALMMGDRVGVLDGGILQQVDRPLLLYHHPANRRVASLVGWPPMSFLDGVVGPTEGELTLANGDARLRVPPAWATFSGRPVTLGIRPEDVYLRPESHKIMKDATSADGGRADLAMQVALIEPLGSMTLVTVRHGEWQLVARTAGQTDVMDGQVVEVTVDMQRAHLFDRSSGRVLTG